MKWRGLGALVLAACGGTAIVDPPDGAGGSSPDPTSTSGVGGTTSSSGSSSTTGVGGAGASGSCDEGFEELTEAIAEAVACDPLINAIQCSGMTVVLDGCGCQVVANDFNQDEAEEALDIYDAWTKAGCGFDCQACPPPPDTAWYCDPMAEQCLPAFE